MSAEYFLKLVDSGNEDACIKYINTYKKFYNEQIRYNYYETTSLIYACRREYTAVVKHLLKSGADINMTTMKSDLQRATTALNCMCDLNKTEMAILLLDNGAQSVIDEVGYTEYMCAAINGDLVLTNALFRHGFDNINIKNKYNRTALMYACSYGHYDVAYKLIDYGADFENIREQPPYNNAQVIMVVNYIRDKYMKIITAVANDESIYNEMSISFCTTYVPQLIDLIVCYII